MKEPALCHLGLHKIDNLNQSLVCKSGHIHVAYIVSCCFLLLPYVLHFLCQEHSPHLGGKSQRWNRAMDADSGYAPTKSQESYGHSQPKSQEAYTSVSEDLSFQHSSSQDYREFTSNSESQTNLTKRTNLHKDEEQKSFSHRFGSQGGGKEPHDNFPITPTKSREPFGLTHSKSMGPDSSYVGSYPGPYSKRGEFHSLPSHGIGFDDSYERRYPPPDYRRSFHGGDYYPDMTAYGGRYGGEYGDMYHSMRQGAGRFQMRRDRLLREELSRMQRTRSHEQMEQSPYGSGRPPFRPGFEDDFREPGSAHPMDYPHLSQPNPPYWGGFDHPGFNPAMHPPMMGYDPRHAMGGPSGVPLSQPVYSMPHGRLMFGRVGRPGMMPYGDSERYRPKSEAFDQKSNRHYSIEDLDEEDELENHLKVRIVFEIELHIC